MYDYCDPQLVHGGECRMCGRWVADNEDLTEDGLCESCAESMESDDESEDA